MTQETSYAGAGTRASLRGGETRDAHDADELGLRKTRVLRFVKGSIASANEEDREGAQLLIGAED